MIFLALPFLAGNSRAAASSISYNFDEAGWVNNFGATESFFGSFTGTVDAKGVLTLGDLSVFSPTITETNAAGQTKTIANFGGNTGMPGLNNFLYDPGANSLNLFATGSPGATICLGNTILLGDCGPVAPRPVSVTGVPAPPLEGIFLSSVNGDLNASTIALPGITAVQGPVIRPQPAPAAAPEPGTLALCGGAFLFTAVVLRIGERWAKR